MKRRMGTSLIVAMLSPIRRLTVVGRVRFVQALCRRLGMFGRCPANFCMRALQTMARF